jgi:4-aminobutyrate aminotransferase-like enzyme
MRGDYCIKAVADSFHNGLEYFNTFGGNPVCAAAALVSTT